MYRPRKGKGKGAAVAPAALSQDSALESVTAVTEDSCTVARETNTTDDTATARAIIDFKAAFTTPSLVYNSSTRSIEVNKHYDRAAVTELSHIQAVLLRGLRDNQRDASRRTPKELLYGLEHSLLLLLASTAVASDAAPLSARGDDHSADQMLPVLESFFAQHTAPAKAIAATAYALSEGLSQRALQSYVEQLQARAKAESEPALERLRTGEESAALAATRHNVSDFLHVLSNFNIAYEAIPRATGSSRPGLLSPVEGAAASAVDGIARGSSAGVSKATQRTSANLLAEAYYSLLRWVLAIDPDRRALLKGYASTSSSTGSTTVTEYEPYNGKIVLSRTSTHTPWGCVFNGRGYLVSISNELRNSSEAGERLFQALQQKSGPELGFPVLEANRRRLRSLELPEGELRAQRANITRGLRDSLTSDARVLHLTIPSEAQEKLTAPQEVVFATVQQGGESAGGQRVLLVLRRASLSIPWGVRMAKDSRGQLVLEEFNDRIRLSQRAREFLFDHRGRLFIVGLNHKELNEHPEAASEASLRETVGNSLLIALWIEVSTPVAVSVGAGEAKLAEPFAAERSAMDAALKSKTIAVDEDARQEDDPAEEREDPEEKDAVRDTEGEIKGEALIDSDGDPAADALEDDDVLQSLQKRKLVSVKSIRQGWGLDEDDNKLESGDDAKALKKLLETTEVGGGADDALGTDAGDRARHALLEENGVATDAADEDQDAELLEDVDGASKLADNDVNDAAPALWGEATVEDVEAIEGETGFADTRKLKSASDAPVHDDAGEERLPDVLEEGDAPGKRTRKLSAKALKAQAKKEKLLAKKEKERLRKEKAKEKAMATREKAATEREAKRKEREEKRKIEEAVGEGDPSDERKAKESEEVTDEKPSADAAAEVEAATRAQPLNTLAEDPLVKGLKTSAEIAVEKSDKKTKARVQDGSAGERETRDAASAEDAAAARVSIADLLGAEPLTFPNDVRMVRFDGHEMELTRAHASVPWQIRVGFVGDEMVLTGLPAAMGDPGVPAEHPYLRYFQPFANPESGNGNRCVVESVNGMDLSLVTKATRGKVYDAIKKASNIKLAVKFIRKH